MSLPPESLLFTPLSDEAATEIADFLMELALAFEETHLGQILRHRASLNATFCEPSRQLSLFDPDDDCF